jgi:hypothetical protein
LQKRYSIEELSRLYETKSLNLKLGFRQLFGLGAFGFCSPGGWNKPKG